MVKGESYSVNSNRGRATLSPCLEGYKRTREQEYKSTRVQEYKSTRVQEYKSRAVGMAPFVVALFATATVLVHCIVWTC